MNKLFWTQNENPSLSNTVIGSDGEVLTYDKKNELSSRIVNDLLDYQETSILKFYSNNLYIREYPKGGVFISSNFLEKDDKGRKMAFMFFTQHTEKDKVIEDLLFFSKKVKRTLVAEDIENINKNINKNNRQILILIAAVLSILIIYILWKKMN